MPSPPPKKYFKNAHNIKNIKNITDAPDGDAKIVADYDDAADNDSGPTDSKKSPYSLRKRDHAPNISDNDDASPNDSASPDSLIVSKRKIDPRSIIKLKKTQSLMLTL